MNMQRAKLTLVAALLVAHAALAGAQTMQKVSLADNSKSYRVDAAKHIYATYPSRVYKGKLPPLIHAIVVTEMDVDERGAVRGLRIIRTPTHAPDVVVAVREMIRQASPMPKPSRLGGAKVMEVWLVDKSGRFQLDTLTEGQR